VCDIVPEERAPQEMFAAIPAHFLMLEEIRRQNPTLSIRALGFALFEKWNTQAKPAVHYDLSDQYCQAITDYLAEEITWERCSAIMGMKRPL
jgi:hypothetical protein